MSFCYSPFGFKQSWPKSGLSYDQFVLPYTRFCNCLLITITFYTLLTSLFCIIIENVQLIMIVYIHYPRNHYVKLCFTESTAWKHLTGNRIDIKIYSETSLYRPALGPKELAGLEGWLVLWDFSILRHFFSISVRFYEPYGIHVVSETRYILKHYLD
jgi:hypothetical protein